MSATVPLQTDLDATNSIVAQHEARITALELQLAKLLAPPYDPQVLWKADMEVGNLSQWGDGSPSGGQVNNGTAVSTAVLAANEGITAHSGAWVMKQQTSGGGTRIHPAIAQIDTLVKAGTPFWLTWYDYYPAQIKFGPNDQFNFVSINGLDANLSYNPVWGWYLNGTDGTLVMVYSPNDKAPLPGPHATDTAATSLDGAGKRAYYPPAPAAPMPIGRWIRFELYTKPAADFSGAIQFYMDGAKLFDLSSIVTRYPGTGDPGVPGWEYIAFMAYGSNLTPVPAVHYVDDVTLSLGRMP
jgi:hypothetical protein